VTKNMRINITKYADLVRRSPNFVYLDFCVFKTSPMYLQVFSL
jgi:hypothetical protein